jgi:hypothetical protein
VKVLIIYCVAGAVLLLLGSVAMLGRVCQISLCQLWLLWCEAAGVCCSSCNAWLQATQAWVAAGRMQHTA